MALCTLLLGTGCSGRQSVYPVTGKVLFENRPAVGALVQFHPEGPADKATLVPQGEVDANGVFHLTTYTFQDGAPPGRYRVTVFWGVPAKGGDGYDRILVPARYLKPETSGLTAVVLEQATELEPFKLTP